MSQRNQSGLDTINEDAAKPKSKQGKAHVQVLELDKDAGVGNISFTN